MSRLVRAVLAVAVLLAGPLYAQGAVPADTTFPRLRIRLPNDSIPLYTFFELQPGGRLGLRVPPGIVGARWEQETRARLHAEDLARRSNWLQPLTSVAQAESTTVDTTKGPPELFPAIRNPAAPAGAPVVGALSQFAQLGLQMHARFEMKLDRLKNERCTAADLANPVSGCQGGFPTPALDQQFNVRAGGLIGQRVHVNVSYDSQNEFSANNNIKVWYEGLEDEIIKRIEVGNVTFQAPPSRFITADIPANSFGVQAQAQLGAFEFRSIFAEQKGSQLRTRTYTVGQQTTQPVDRQVRDLDFEAGRFFFVVDPRTIPGYPGIDVLSLTPDLLPASQRPVQVRIYRLRAQNAGGATNPNLGGINAVALRKDSPQRVGPFPWQLLVEGKDYYLDPSGFWFALATKVSDQDFLAVSYITAGGDTVGTFPAVNRGLDTLQLIYEPRRGPDAPTFFYEMRNVYRVGGSDVQRESLQATLVVNESEQPLDGHGTYLSRLGLAKPTDQSTVDQYNRLFPRDRDPNKGAPIQDYFLVFPELTPFADSAKLQAGERNDSLYKTPTYLLASQGPPPRFLLRLHYDAVGAGDRTTLNLGGYQIRQGSEKLFINNQQLVRGQDYQIEYDLGQVIFLHPDSLFPGPTQVTAQFEENQSFDQAPKSIVGLSTTYDLGSRGQINAIGLFQKESSLETRPRLGFEPQANFIGGLSTQLQFQPDAVTRGLDALPLIHTNVPSTLTANGEIAVSRPNPNQAGQAYIEEFENASAQTVPLLENAFQLGSRPSSGRGLPAAALGVGGEFQDVDAVPITWQSVIQVPGGVLQFYPNQIDSTIVTTGATDNYEPNVLWVTLKPDTVGGAPDPATGAPRWFRPHTPGPRWRSITQSFGGSGLGLDLSRVEYLEFWVLEDPDRTAKQANTDLVFDFGQVFEDATAFGPDSFSVANGDTTFSGFQFIGRGVLNTERDTLTNTFNAATNDIGILGDLLPRIVNANTGTVIPNFPMCSANAAAGLAIFPLGDLAARCTRHDGRAETEDLNGDNRLDITVGTGSENFFRYVFPIGSDKYFVRNGVTTIDSVSGKPLTWRLYRIPFRQDTLQIGTPNIRQIQAMRLTVVAPDQGAVPEKQLYFALARMQLVGAPWLKRAATPIAGLGGSTGQPHGEVVASVVTTENQDLGYTSPPGVTNQASQVGAAFQVGSQQINEKSLRLLATDLRVGERAEAFVRFADQADKNFLGYRKLRVWARGRGPGWEDGDLEFYIKAGTDENNFYLYKTRVHTSTWEPEVVIDLQKWLLLRAKVEAAWLRGDPPSGSKKCGGDSTAYVACDGNYLVQVRDPAVAPPNLAAVSEMSVGMLRVHRTVFIGQAELWVDDIRLSDVVTTPGVAGAVDLHLQAADVADVAYSFSTKDDHFRQLSESPTYVTNVSSRLNTTFRLDKLLPTTWGLSIPVNFQYTRTGDTPFYLNNTDVRADALTGLRTAHGVTTAYNFSLRRVQKGKRVLTRVLADPVSFNASIQHSTNTTQLTDAESNLQQYHLEYNSAQAGPRTIRALPRFVISLVRHLPRFISNSDFARNLEAARLRWNPFQLRAASTLTNDLTNRFTFRVPVALASDSALAPLPSVIHTLRNEGALELRPFPTFSARVDYTSTRDLQNYGDSTTIGRLAERQRKTLLGHDVGFETAQTLNTTLSTTPFIARWFRPRISLTSSFTLNRDPNGQAIRAGPDSSGAFRLPESFTNGRRQDLGVSVDPANLVRNLFGDSSFVAALFRRIVPFDLAASRDRLSSFDQTTFNPSLAYHLGLGGVNQFRSQRGVTATSASESRSRSVSGGLLLPLGLGVRLNYLENDAVRWARQGITDYQTQVNQVSRDWPGPLTVTWTMAPGRTVRRTLSSISGNFQWRRTTTTTTTPLIGDTTGAAAVTETRSSDYGPSLTLTWKGGVVTSGQFGTSKTDAITSGNITRTLNKRWGGSVSFAFRPPRSVVRLSNSVQTSLTLNTTTTAVCLLQTGTTDCTPVSDSRRQELDLRMDTGVATNVRGGLSFSYILTEQQYLSVKTAQYVFSVFAEVNFLSGQIR